VKACRQRADGSLEPSRAALPHKPVYIEGVWGGFFIKRLRELPSDMKNCAWVFDLIPNEVSVLMKLGSDTFEIPFPTLFRALPRKLMGEESFARFGRLFPIRFNYDDTYEGGGNMSVQVHPGRDYAKEHFGEPFQQDESYYVVATAGSRTYLGLQDDAKAEEFFDKIRWPKRNTMPSTSRKSSTSFFFFRARCT
jgi:mannose-6-phosphate isomerase class I